MDQLASLARALSGLPPRQLRTKLAETINNEVHVPDLKLRPLSKSNKKYLLAAVDAASASIHIPSGEIAIAAGAVITGRNLKTYPAISGVAIGPPYVGAPADGGISWVTSRYLKLGTPYFEDPDLPEGALSHDVRISIETYLIKNLKMDERNTILLIDGPAVYPFTHPTEGSKWNAEIGLLNEDRVNAMTKLLERGIIPACIVKRVWRSSYIPTTISGHGVKDVEYLMSKILDMGGQTSKPLVLGPWEARSRVGLPDRYMAYLVIPTNPYLRNYSIFRVEIVREVAETLGDGIEDILSTIAYGTYAYGGYVHPTLQVVDKVTKDLVSRLARTLETALRMAGVPIMYGGVGVE